MAAMRTPIPSLMSAALLGACGLGSTDASAPAEAATRAGVEMGPIHEKTVTSQPYHIDAKYASMLGPWSIDKVVLLDTDKPELVWITGYETTVIGAEDGAEMSQEFMCHANLDLEPSSYFEAFPTAPSLSGRLFTLSQGQQRIDFPPGFGIPVPSDMPLSLATQVLNLNLDEVDLNVRHRVTVRFVRDREVKGEMKPMFQSAVEGFKALEGARHYGVAMDEVDPDLHGPGCDIGQAAVAGDFDEDRHGQKFSAHWVVNPGREVNRTNVTRFLNLPYDTTAHYIAVHLHPFAERLVLRDLTKDEVVFEAKVDLSDGRIGIDRVDHFTSVEGLKLYKDHEYELISHYHNTSDQPVDSMAVMYLYLLDRRFEKPAKLIDGA